MSREIKFRAWSNEHNRYCDFVTLDEDGRWIGWIKSNGVYLTTADIILEQYTGANDKNGKEICEWDIVAVKDEDIPFALVNAISTDKWLVRFNMHRASFALVKSTRRRNFIRTFQHIKPEDIEVIGNIHENQEMLGDEE